MTEETIDWAPTSIAAIRAMHDKAVGLAYELGREFVIEGRHTERHPFADIPSLEAAYQRGVRDMQQEEA